MPNKCSKVFFVIHSCANQHRLCIIGFSSVVTICLFLYVRLNIDSGNVKTTTVRFRSYVELHKRSGVTTESVTLPDSLEVLQAGLFGADTRPLPTRSPAAASSTRRWARPADTFNGTYITANIVVLALQRLTTGRRFAIFSCESASRDYIYSFFLPLTALAWRRLGYGSIVLIVGELRTWAHTPTLEHILRHTLRQGAVVVFLEGVSPRHAVMVSQCSRLFVPGLLSSAADLNSSLLITTDVDIWPLRSDLFTAPLNDTSSVVSVNSFCCAPFRHKGREHRMLPLTFIVATGAVWRSLVAQKGEPPRSSDAIIVYFEREFGDLARMSVRKGENVGWYMDQHMISLLLEEWQRLKGDESLRLVRRDIGHDRIDSNRWSPWQLEGLQDAHVLQGTYRTATWRKVQPLLKLMHGWVSEDYRWCELYHSGFVELYSAQRR